jgi:transcription initiation factor IIE alpha subunit
MGALLRLLSEKMRMVREDALAVSRVVEEAFQGGAEVDDESLDKDLRQVFYDLQDERILDVRRVETREDGHARRHYLWRVREEEAGKAAPEAAAVDPEARVYQRLDARHWERRKAKA